MTSNETAHLAFLGFLIGLIFALAIAFGEPAEQRDVWTPQTVGEPVPAQVDP